MKPIRDAWLIAVVCVAVCAAALLYHDYWPQRAARWGRLDNDRNSHYLTALKLGSDLRSFHLGDAVDDLRRIRSWPPLHPVIVGLTSAVVGPRYELAVLPNVVAWGAGVLLLFLLARTVAGPGGAIAGCVAVSFYLASPSHRAFATDFMLESMGATLTLLVLWLYAGYCQSDSHSVLRNPSVERNRLRYLAVALTLLFFEKYNYWLLVVLSLALVEAWQHRPTWIALRDHVTSAVERPALWAWLRRQSRLPWNAPIAVLGSIAVAAFARQRWQSWSGHVSPSSHENLIHFLFVAVVLRGVVYWKQDGKPIWDRIPGAGQVFLRWHAVPIAIWFLLPKRLGYFLWYLSPSNGPNTDDIGLSESARYYWHQAQDWYHLTPWLAWTAVALAILSLVRLPSMSRAGQVMVVFVLLSLALTLNHPNQKARFLHSWMAGVWVLAGVGSVTLGERVRWPGSSQGTAWLPIAVAASLIVVQCPSWRGAGASPESGHWAGKSSLPLASAYLPWLSPSRRTAILGTLPIEHYAEWTYVSQFPGQPRPITAQQLRWFGPDPEQNRIRFRAWLDESHPDQIVLVDVRDASPIGFPDFEHFRQYRALIAEQKDYRRTREFTIDDLECVVSLWEPVPKLASRPDRDMVAH